MGILLEGCPCDYCGRKEEDEYGLICDWACGAYTAHSNFMAGAKAQLKKIMEWIEGESCNAACQCWKDYLLEALWRELTTVPLKEGDIDYEVG